jgi:NTE family protein
MIGRVDVFMFKTKDAAIAPPRHHPRRISHARSEDLNKITPVAHNASHLHGFDKLPNKAPIGSPRRAKLGIALGAGAARGWAHIGVLLELTEQGIYPDVVAGTSIGAVVGGCYAANKLEMVDIFARSLTKKRVVSMMDVSFSGVGLLTGGKLKQRLDETFSGGRVEDFERGFAAVATEIDTGHEIWLTKGDAVEAIRASYALPGIFEPVRINGRWLFDGALVNPVPVTVCRALGADIVIAVNLIGDNAFRGTVVDDRLSIEPTLERFAETPDTGRSLTARLFGGMRGGNLRHLFGRREDGAPGVASAMMDAFNIAQARISRSRLAGDPPDVMINARVSKIGLFDFHRADELIEIGREATRRVILEIADHIALTPADDDASAQAT